MCGDALSARFWCMARARWGKRRRYSVGLKRHGVQVVCLLVKDQPAEEAGILGLEQVRVILLDIACDAAVLAFDAA